MEPGRAVLVEKGVARQVAFPMADAITRVLELSGPPERVNGVDGLREGVRVVERDLHLEPLDPVRILLELPYFDGFELVARHRRPAREIAGQQVDRMRDQLVAVPKPDGVAVPRMRA